VNVRNPVVALVAFCSAILVWSAIRPLSYDVWAFEIAAGVIGVAVLAATHRRFPFSNLVYVLAGIHFAILAIAAKYSYAEMPLFTWLRDTLHLARNHYDRVGHFAQGFVPAVIVREILLRTTGLRRGNMLSVLCACVCLAISASWEIIASGTDTRGRGGFEARPPSGMCPILSIPRPGPTAYLLSTGAVFGSEILSGQSGGH